MAESIRLAPGPSDLPSRTLPLWPESTTVLDMSCKYSDFCSLPSYVARNHEQYCLLHDPPDGKNPNDFRSALAAQVASGHTDFRYLHAPANATIEIADVRFASRANFTDMTMSGILDFPRVTFADGLLLSSASGI